jgi:DNA-binding MarR family transcriptional regulator
MENDLLTDSIVEDLLTTVPMLHRIVRRNFLKDAFSRLEVDISPPHLGIMMALAEYGSMNMTQVGEEFQLAKPQVTHLVDRLVDLGLVERETDEKDRRNILITLTAVGRDALGRFRQMIKEAVKSSLSASAYDDLKDLATSLETMRNVLSKLK